MKIFGHRGAAGNFPENTMLSFEAAWREGADAIELDVQLTKDNILAVIHDETVDRTTNGSGLVKQYTYEELQRLNASHKFVNKVGKTTIPMLQEVYEWALNNDLMINVELKNNVINYYGLEESVINLTRKYGYEDRVILSSFNHESMWKCHQLASDIETALISTRVMNNPTEYVKLHGAKAIHTNFKHVKEKDIKHFLESDLDIRVYTVNTDKGLGEMCALHVSGIITDYPKKAVLWTYKLEN
ncbi:MAG: glycerophosphodiester phosphodiesterase [Bacillaceae bacterium]